MTSSDALPEFPLTITTHRDGDAWTFERPEDLLDAIDTFNSDDPERAASVTDGRGRLVRLVVENRHIIVLECLPGWPIIEL